MKLYKAIDPATGKFTTGMPLILRGIAYFVRNREVCRTVVEIKNELQPESHLFKVLPSQVCELTGIKDSHGRLIWENDVIRISAPGKAYDGIEGIVVYEKDFASWCIGWDFEFGTTKAMITFQDCIENGVKIRVIGNITKEGFDCPQGWYNDQCWREQLCRNALDDLPF